jgi:predicted transcriptional regulator
VFQVLVLHYVARISNINYRKVMMKKSTLGAKPLLFLRKLLAHYPELTFSVPHKIIADNFAMPPSTVSKYLKLLVETSFVIQEKVDDIFKDNGVAKYRYQISEAGVKLVNSFTLTNSAHQELIARIQSDDFKKNLKELYETHTLPEKDKRYAVNTDDCVLLLEVLLNQANQYGVILGLTRGNLSNIVGFKVAKIQRLTKILRSLDLITQVTPGLSGFFGVQPSIYQIALTNPLYEAESTYPVLPNININFQYNEKLKLPAADLIEKIVNIDILKEIIDPKAIDEKGQQLLDTLDKLKVYLTAPRYKMITYCNSLMTIFAVQVLRENDELDKLITILKNGVVNDASEIKSHMRSQFKAFLESTILSTTKRTSDIDTFAGVLLPFFLENLLHIELLLNELEKLGYRKLISINTTVVSLREPQLNILVTFESQDPIKGLECTNYNGKLYRQWQNQQLKVNLEPDLKGLI